MRWTPPHRAHMVGAWPAETLVQPETTDSRRDGSGVSLGRHLYLIAVTALQQLRRSAGRPPVRAPE